MGPTSRLIGLWSWTDGAGAGAPATVLTTHQQLRKWRNYAIWFVLLLSRWF